MFFNRRSFIEEFLRGLDDTFIIIRIRESTAHELIRLTNGKDEVDAIEKLIEMWKKYGINEELAKEVIDYVRKFINKNVTNITEAVRQLLADNQKLRYEVELLKKQKNNRKIEHKSSTEITSLITIEQTHAQPQAQVQTQTQVVHEVKKEEKKETKVTESKPEEKPEAKPQLESIVSDKLSHLVITYDNVRGNELFTPTMSFIILNSKADEIWNTLTSKYSIDKYGIYRLSNGKLLLAIANVEISKAKEDVTTKIFDLSKVKCVEKTLTIDDVEKEPELVNYLRNFIQFFKEPLPGSVVKEIEKICK